MLNFNITIYMMLNSIFGHVNHDKKQGVYIYGKEKRFPLETTTTSFVPCGLKVELCPI